MPTKKWQSYEDRLDRVTAWILDHLDDDLDLNHLAEIACLSPYHWHRIYQAMRGETVSATVKRLRLGRAALYLAETALPIDRVARQCGYNNPQSFTRIFKSVFGMSPARYRREGGHIVFQPQHQKGPSTMFDVTIKPIPDRTAITVNHTGPYMDISRAFGRLFDWLGARQMIPADAQMIAVYYDDPDLVSAEKLRSRAGILTEADLSIEPPLDRTVIQGGDYAVLRYKGPYANMIGAYRWLYGEWLPQSGREPENLPALEQYLNNPVDTAPTELLTDIYLPLKSA